MATGKRKRNTSDASPEVRRKTSHAKVPKMLQPKARNRDVFKTLRRTRRKLKMLRPNARPQETHPKSSTVESSVPLSQQASKGDVSRHNEVITVSVNEVIVISDDESAVSTDDEAVVSSEDEEDEEVPSSSNENENVTEDEDQDVLSTSPEPSPVPAPRRKRLTFPLPQPAPAQTLFPVLTSTKISLYNKPDDFGTVEDIAKILEANKAESIQAGRAIIECSMLQTIIGNLDYGQAMHITMLHAILDDHANDPVVDVAILAFTTSRGSAEEQGLLCASFLERLTPATRKVVFVVNDTERAHVVCCVISFDDNDEVAFAVYNTKSKYTTARRERAMLACTQALTTGPPQGVPSCFRMFVNNSFQQRWAKPWYSDDCKKVETWSKPDYVQTWPAGPRALNHAREQTGFLVPKGDFDAFQERYDGLKDLEDVLIKEFRQRNWA